MFASLIRAAYPSSLRQPKTTATKSDPAPGTTHHKSRAEFAHLINPVALPLAQLLLTTATSTSVESRVKTGPVNAATSAQTLDARPHDTPEAGRTKVPSASPKPFALSFTLRC